MSLLFSAANAAVYAAFAVFAAKAASETTDLLYAKKPEILSFPSETQKRATFRIPLTVAGLMLAFPALASESSPTIVAMKLAIVWFLLMVTCTDFEQQVIFDAIMLPFCLLATMFMVLGAIPFADGFFAAFVGGGLFLLLAIITRGGIGGGDIKLVFALGLWFGSEKLFDIVCIGAAAAGIVAALLIAAKKKKRRDFIAYGPYFALTAIILTLI